MAAQPPAPGHRPAAAAPPLRAAAQCAGAALVAVLRPERRERGGAAAGGGRAPEGWRVRRAVPAVLVEGPAPRQELLGFA